MNFGNCDPHRISKGGRYPIVWTRRRPDSNLKSTVSYFIDFCSYSGEIERLFKTSMIDRFSLLCIMRNTKYRIDLEKMRIERMHVDEKQIE